MDEVELNDEEISNEINQQLASITLDDSVEDDAVVSELPELTVSTVDTKFLYDLEKRLSSQRVAFEHQLEDCSNLLHSAEDKIASCKAIVDFGELTKEYGEQGEDAQQFRARVLEAIAAEDELEDSVTDTSLDEDSDTELAAPVFLQDQVLKLNFVGINNEADQQLDDEDRNASDIVNVTEEAASAVKDGLDAPAEGDGEQSHAIVLYDENNLTILQKAAAKQISKLKKRQKIFSEKQELDYKQSVETVRAREEQEKGERERRLQLTKLEEEAVQALTAERENNLKRELEKKELALSNITKEFETQIYELEKQTQAEKLRLKAEISKIKENRANKEIKSAILIQSVYRGYRVRLIYGEKLKECIADKVKDVEMRLLEKAQERINVAEQKKKEKEEQQQREEEEKVRLREEANRKALEANRAREEELRLKREKELEEKRIKEEKIKEEKRLQEEEKRRKKEEKERLRAEKERLKAAKAEQLKAEKEARIRAEHEALKAKEEERLKAEKEAKLKAESEETERLERQKEEKKKAESKQKEQDEQLNAKQELTAELNGTNSREPVSELPKTINDTDLESGESDLPVGRNLDVETDDTKLPSDGVPVKNGPTSTDSTNPESLGSGDGSGMSKSAASSDPNRQFLEEAHDVNGIAKISNRNLSKSVHENLNGISKEQAKAELEASQYKVWKEERRAAKNKNKFILEPRPPATTSQVDVSLLEAKIEERRKRWMEECTPWSQISSTAKNSMAKARKSFRRPSSAAKKQEPISEELILRQAEKSSLSLVEAVQLKDLPGCTLSTLRPCKRLRALCLKSSGVCAIDSLDGATKFQYADLKGNAIDSVHLVSSALVYLNLSSNNISSIRGFESCVNIKYLNLSSNKISKLCVGKLHDPSLIKIRDLVAIGLEANLGFFKNLHTLDVSRNDLISTKGLGECVTLQVLDLSYNHLTSLDGLNNLCLLRKLAASANNLMEIPRLTNCVLLSTLCLDDNSISSLNGLAFFWLPCLTSVNLSQNGISTIQVLHGCYSLSSLDLSHNQLIDHRNLVDGLKFCINLNNLMLEGNPLNAKELNRSHIESALPQLRNLNNAELSTHKPIEFRSEVLSMCSKALLEFSTLEKEYQPILSDHLSQFPLTNEELLKGINRLEEYYEAADVLAENLRYAHEYGTMTFDTYTSPPTRSAKALFEAKVADASRPADVEVVLTAAPTAKDLFELKLRSTLDSTELRVSTENMKIIKGAPSPRPHSRSKSNSIDDRTKACHSRPPLSGLKSARKHDTYSDVAENGAKHDNDLILDKNEESKAAVKIQALWRGYSFRQRLVKALEYANIQGGEGSDEDMPEIDLSAFDFDIDDEWRPPSTPSLPQKHAVLPSKSFGDKADNMNSIPYQQFDRHQREAWRHSPALDTGRPPVPSLSSMSGEISHRSKREEMIAEDWGFKDAHTAELMMKRAKKLKYNAQRKKKLNQLDAVGRYEFHQKVLENVEPPKVVAPVRKTAPRIEYFKALEEESRRKSLSKTAERDVAVERTYEWIHTQVSSGDTDRGDRQGSGDSQLPYMDKRVLDGGRTQLVGSPLEIMSVDSYYGASSAGSHRTGGQQSTQHSTMSHHSQRTGNPSKQYNKSTMSSHAKQTSQKPSNHKFEEFNAWGSGKRRTKR